ncbi:MAG: EamA family transporter [Chloroflexota bacterium]|jgi:drug/metabolite transporter (DMT)-like permease
MLALLGGFGAACCFAAATLASARASRELGARVVLGWVMLIGIVLVVPWVVVAGGAPPTAADVPFLLVAGFGNSIGLLFAYSAFGTGKVSIAAPIVSTEGALSAVIAIALGEPVAIPLAIALGVVAIGVLLAARERDPAGSDVDSRLPPPVPIAPEPMPIAEVSPTADTRRPAVLAGVAAIMFGFALYATAHLGTTLSPAWVSLPSRLTGLLVVTVPLVLAGGLRSPGAAAPYVVIVGVAEVAGTACIAVGAAAGIAVTSVLASQFAVIAALGAYALLGERLARIQLAGVALTIAGVATVALLRA